MQPSLQAASVTGWGGTLSSTSPYGKSIPVTVGAGSNKTLILVLQADDSTGAGWTVTFNGVAMSLLVAQPTSSAAASSIWYLHNPPEGTFDAFVGVGSWTGASCIIHCSVWNDVDQDAPFGTPLSQSNPYQESPYIGSIEAAADDVTLNAFVIYSGAALTITPGQTQLGTQRATGNSRYGVSSYKLGASSSVSNSWTGGSGTQPAQVSVVLKGAAGVGAASHPTTASIAAQSASVSGFSSRTRGHAATGTLTAIAATIVGASARSGSFVTHATSGDLIAASSTISGSASRSTASISHVTTGSASASSASVIATASRSAAGQLTTDIIANNTMTPLANTAVVWSWLPIGRIGSLAAITPIDGTGTTGSDGRLTVSGLTAGAGILLVAKQNSGATDDDVFYQAGTVA